MEGRRWPILVTSVLISGDEKRLHTCADHDTFVVNYFGLMSCLTPLRLTIQYLKRTDKLLVDRE